MLFLFALKAHHIYRIRQHLRRRGARAPTSPSAARGGGGGGEWRGSSEEEKQRCEDEECAIAALARELDREERALQWVHEQRMLEDLAAHARGDAGAAARIANARSTGSALPGPAPLGMGAEPQAEAGDGGWVTKRRGRAAPGSAGASAEGPASGEAEWPRGRQPGDTAGGGMLDSTAALAAAAAAAAAVAMAAAAGPRAGSGAAGGVGGGGVSGADHAGKAVCSVCLSGPRDTAVLPCKHLGLCVSCAKHLCQTVRSRLLPSTSALKQTISLLAE